MIFTAQCLWLVSTAICLIRFNCGDISISKNSLTLIADASWSDDPAVFVSAECFIGDTNALGDLANGVESSGHSAHLVMVPIDGSGIYSAHRGLPLVE